MSIKSKVLAAAASLTMISGLGVGAAVTAGTANAATPSCGFSCIDIFSHQFGTFHQPQFVLDVYKQGQNIGQPIILFRTSNTDPAEDFTLDNQGTVADFFAAGLVSSAVALHYGCIAGVNFPDCTNGADFYAVEIEYAPFGADTGLCVGTGATAASGTKIALESCGTSSKTVWILDGCYAAPKTNINTFGVCDSPDTISIPLINGSDTNFSHPFVMTYPGSSYPTDKPRPQLYTSNLTGFSNGNGPILGSVNSNQLWAADFGPLF